MCLDADMPEREKQKGKEGQRTVVFEIVTLISNSETFQDGNGNGNAGKFIQMTFKMVIGNQ